MADHDPFDPQQLQILLLLVGDHSAEEVLRHEPEPVREQLRAIEKKLKVQLAEFATAEANPHEDLVRKTFADQWWYAPQMPLDEVLLRARSRLRHDHDEKCSVVVENLRQLRSRFDALEISQKVAPSSPESSLTVTITGPQAQATVVARAVVEMLGEADISASMPEEAENPYDGDSIEQLGGLRRGLRDGRVIVQTSAARGARCTCGEDDGSASPLPHKTWCPKAQEESTR